MHLRRLSSRLLPLVLVALLAGACSSVTDDAAVTVEGTELPASAVEEELEAITSSADYQAGIEQQFGVPLAGEGEGTYSTAFVARLLSLQTYYELLEQEVDRRDLEVTDEDLDATRDQVVDSVGGAEAFDAFPASYQDALLRRRALLGVVEAAFRNEGMDEGEAFYDENVEQFESRCVAHLLVGTSDGAQPTGSRTNEEAAARARELYEQIQAGADFAELAASDANDDTTAAAEAGDLGCLTPTAGFDPDFLSAAFDAEVGEVTEPVETQFGYHLILVSSADTPPYADIEAEVEQAMAAANAGLFNEFLIDATCGSDIEVASRYGTWDTSACTDDASSGIGQVAPPEGPVGGGTPVDPAAGAGG